jgi:hypothetical protein
MIKTTTAISTAMPRFVPRKGKRCVSFDCQLVLSTAAAAGLLVSVGLVPVTFGVVLMVLLLVGSPSMRGFEAGLVDIVREGRVRMYWYWGQVLLRSQS